jgi:hypothetical protein
LDDGRVQSFQIEAGAWQSVDLNPAQLATGQPPLLNNGSEAALLVAPADSASILTHAVPTQGSDWSQVFIDEDGNLVRVDKNSQPLPKLAVDALPDARILQDVNQQVLLLTGPTTRYNHGVLGDAVEANHITLIPDLASGRPVTISMPGDLVIEGLAPIWVDWDGDGNREIIVTVSDALRGAQILMFNEAGEQIAAGPAIGQGYRWRHQISVAPFGPSGEMELVDVLTPHLGGVVEFYRWDGAQLKIVAQLPGYTSHVIGTRNLDMAVAGDFDGDGMLELLLPRQDRLELGAIHHLETGAFVDWSLPLEAKLATNIGAVKLTEDSLAIGVGLENGILTVWHP